MRWRRWVIPLATLVAVIVVAIVIPTIDAEPAAEPADATTTTEAPDPGPGPGVTDGEIVLGVLAATSGDAQAAGLRALAGHEAYWDAHPLVGDRRITLDVQDGALDRATSATAFRIMEDDVAMISSSVGTSYVAADAALIGLLVVADSTVEQWSGVATVLPNAGLAAPGDEVEAGVLWAFGGGSLARSDADAIGIVVGDGVAGGECLAGLDDAALLLGATVATVEVADPAAPDVGGDVESLQDAGASVAVICVSPSYLLAFDAAADAAGYAPTVIATSESYEASLGARLSGDVYVVTAMPPWESDEPGVAEMRRAAIAAGVGDDVVDGAFYVGYTQAATAHAVLLAAEADGGMGREAFLAALARGVEVDLQMGGIPVTIGLASEERVPAIATGIYRPAPTTEWRFGLEPVADPFVVPSG